MHAHEQDLYLKRLQAGGPRFHFPHLTPVRGFSFEPLTTENFAQLYLLFENDDSPFVDARFKTYNGAQAYAHDLVNYGPYAPKHGGRDWFFLLPDGQYAGVLHLYDLSLETFAQNHKRAWVGFATKAACRKQGITATVFAHFIRSLFQYYPQIDFLHAMTLEANTPAHRFLQEHGFVFDATERLSKEHYFYLRTRNGI